MRKKIYFCYTTYDKRLLQESKRYLRALRIPSQYVIEIKSMEQERIDDQKYSDDSYLICLHACTMITDTDFLYKMIHAFEQEPQLHIVGVSGYRKQQLCGNIYLHDAEGMQQLTSPEVKHGVTEADQADVRLFMMKACEESLQLLKHMKNMSSIVSTAARKLGILENDCATCLFEQYTVAPAIEVSKPQLPLVSILIPTYNRPHYFEQALQSALQQTYPRIEIIIGDDSTNDETERLVKKRYLPYYHHITYIRNENRLGQFRNSSMLIEAAKGEYINLLMDDDLFHPNKIEKMLQYYITDFQREIMLVTSHRHVMDDRGNPLLNHTLSQPVFEKDTIIDGRKMGNLFLMYNFNYIGEPTTVLFRKQDLEEPFGMLFGRQYVCNVDTATWLMLLSKGKAVYLVEPLSSFRIHKEQQQQDLAMLIGGFEDLAHQLLHSREMGFLQDAPSYREAIQNYIENVKLRLSAYVQVEQLEGYQAVLREWEQLQS